LAVVTEFSPAKINLFLAVTGRRGDGYHDLVSVAAPLDFGDELCTEARGKGEGGAGAQFTLECDDPAVPVDGSNLVLKAADAFARATGLAERVHFKLAKRIPLGAGLGGGSSNAVAALRALHARAVRKLSEDELGRLAAGLGSDCALFLHRAPVVMRGRGERVAPLPESAALRLRGRRLLLFKPSFGIPTPWAYAAMARRGGDYLPAPEAEARLAGWVNAQQPAEDLLFNNLEPAAFAKHPALPLLLAKVRAEGGVAAAMSGSGSACFALLPDGATGELVAKLRRTIGDCWGPAAWVREARIA
jgi:4-diphosphocytidyl-2-C-methyl-D-erythritol kinase